MNTSLAFRNAARIVYCADCTLQITDQAQIKQLGYPDEECAFTEIDDPLCGAFGAKRKKEPDFVTKKPVYVKDPAIEGKGGTSAHEPFPKCKDVNCKGGCPFHSPKTPEP